MGVYNMLFPMKFRRSKSVIWALNIAVIIGIMLNFAALYKKKEDKLFDPSTWKVFEAILEEGIGKDSNNTGNQGLDVNKFTALWCANISGFITEEKPKDPGGDEVKSKINSLDGILSVGAILLDPKVSEHSWVRIHYLDPQDSNESDFRLQVWTKEGDPLKHPHQDAPYNGKVLKIFSEEVLFSFNGEEILMKLESFKYTPKETQGKIKAPKETKEVAPGKWNLSLKETNYLRTEAGIKSELNMISLVSFKNPATGKSVLQLSEVKEGSLAAKRGFKMGDSLISINGYPVHNEAGLINYFNNNPNEGTYVLEISRNGTRIFKTFNAPTD